MYAKPDERRIPASIPVLWALLDAQPGAGTEHVGGHSGVFRSSPPGRVDVMALRDLRTQPGEHAELWSVLRTLLTVAQQLGIRDLHGRPLPIPRSVPGASAWLHLRLDELCAAAWVDDAWHDLRAVHSQLRSAVGDPSPRPLGPCRKLVDTHGRPWKYGPELGVRDDGPFECGAPLYLPGQALKGMDEPVHLPSAIQCGACGGVYSRVEIVQLGHKRGQQVPA